MELQGQVEGIIYQNEANSYTIANLDTDNEEITIVGYLPFIREGDTLRVMGNYVEHKDYGTQFKVSTFEKIMPENLEALEKYLASGAIKGVGEATAKRIIKTFGNETIDIIKNQPEKLSNVKGISEEKRRKHGQRLPADAHSAAHSVCTVLSVPECLCLCRRYRS